MQRPARLFVLGTGGLLLHGCCCAWPDLSPSGCGYDSGSYCDDDDADGYSDCSSDCDDDDPTVNPGADETCNGIDEDCDGAIDDGIWGVVVYYVDADDDGYGGGSGSTEGCSIPAGHADNNDDCDDENDDARPDGVEVCDGADNDCDGDIDEDVPDAATWYADADGDGYGNADAPVVACDAPEAHVAASGDCNDAAAEVAPGLVEICHDGIDQDCTSATADACGYTALSLDDTLAGGGLGSRDEERLGGALAYAGDLDGDGNGDFVVGNAGAGALVQGAYVVMGPVNGVVELDDVAGRLETGESGDEAGTSLAGGGDVDGDGYLDLLMGAPAATVDGAVRGSAWLVYGPEVTDCSPFCDGARLDGDLPDGRFGQAVAIVGDVDGDGLDDVLVGAPARDGGGAVALFTDAPAGMLGFAEATARLGSPAASAAGSGLGAAGDVDGDGLADLAVLDTSAGLAWLLPGTVSGEVDLASALASISPPLGDATAGSLVLADLDGDGNIDVLASGLRDESTATDAVAWGNFGPLAGSLAGEDFSVTTGGGYANAGAHAVAMDDIDFDGAGELFLASPAAAALLPPDYDEILSHGAAAWLVPGPISASWHLADSSARVSLDGDAVPAAAGDLDGDLRPDLLLGVPGDDTMGTDAGAVYVLSGGALP
ncbi:MAG: FG-GAP repeat protein [Deltaproteobacteria bacterium]|nr:FG-GAP repeat protein [Deltaproteobacteria bacterium]